MKFIKENPALAAGVGLPVLLVILLILATLIPQWTVAPPQYDFLFTSSSYENKNDYEVRFSVRDGKLKAEQHRDDDYRKSNSQYDLNHLYRYDAKTGNVSEISFNTKNDVEDNKWNEFEVESAKSLQLSNNSIAPDGYQFYGDGSYYSGGGMFFPFGGSSYHSGIFLAKSGRKVTVPLTTINRYSYNYYNTKFIGWVIPQDATAGEQK